MGKVYEILPVRNKRFERLMEEVVNQWIMAKPSE
jgi:hypothetical protein